MSSSVRVIREKRGPVYVEWEIKDYFVHTTENGCLESPVFYFSDRTQWWLRIYPNGGIRDPGYIAFYLCKEVSNEEYNIAFKLGIMKSNQAVLHAREANYTFKESSISNGYPTFLSKSVLMKSIPPGDRILKVFCNMRFADNAVMENACGTDFPRSHDILTQNLKDLYLGGRLCDITITVKDKDFHAHKCVLASRCPVLLTAENGSNTVNITDCDPDSFNDFLLFLYTAKLDDILPSNVFGLYETAKKYHVKELEEECVPLMERYLCDDTFSETVLIAVKYNESELLMSAIRYLMKNTNKILESTKWNLFMSENSEISSEFLEKFAIFTSGEAKKYFICN